jgi:hypothetical protein
MRQEAHAFSAKVELPCRGFCGPDSRSEFSGVATRIDTGSLVFTTKRRNREAFPEVGDTVRLELSLPVNSSGATPKFLTLRAEVVRVIQRADRSWQLEFTFRKPRFTDTAHNGVKKGAKRIQPEWEH